MLVKTVSALALTALIMAALPAVAQTTAPAAPTTPEAAHEARKAQMEIFAKTLGDLARGLSSDKVADAQKLVDGFTNLPPLFDPALATVNTLPNIWTDNANFLMRYEDAKAASETVLAAAQSGDQAALLASLQALNQACMNCHMTFRGDVGR